jgi:hypothetical protein
MCSPPVISCILLLGALLRALSGELSHRGAAAARCTNAPSAHRSIDNRHGATGVFSRERQLGSFIRHGRNPANGFSAECWLTVLIDRCDRKRPPPFSVLAATQIVRSAIANATASAATEVWLSLALMLCISCLVDDMYAFRAAQLVVAPPRSPSRRIYSRRTFSHLRTPP